MMRLESLSHVVALADALPVADEAARAAAGEDLLEVDAAEALEALRPGLHVVARAIAARAQLVQRSGDHRFVAIMI